MNELSQRLSLSGRLQKLRETLSAQRRSGEKDPVEAVVAILLFEDPNSGLNTLLIHRMQRRDDPWSGQIGLPGGRIEKTDPSSRDALKREVREEVGIDLDSEGEELGRLGVGYPARRMEMKVQPWAYGLKRRPEVIIGPEVEEAFWVPLSGLPSKSTTTEVEIRGERRSVEAFLVDGKIVWGFTHRVLTELLQIPDLTL